MKFQKLLRAFLAAQTLLAPTKAQIQAPAPPGLAPPISPSDRIYTGDQTSNTLTVIDPSQNRVLGTISLGDTRLSNTLNPQYIRSVSSHGLGFSRDGKYIVSLSVLTNTVTVIRTADNRIVSQTSVDRGPHEAFFAPDNTTIWIGTRGVSSVNIIDGINGTLTHRIPTADGPSKVLFSPDGLTAYVNHIRAPVISVIDVASKQVKYNITGLADTFSSDMMLDATGYTLIAAHKMTGQISVVDVHARRVIANITTGPETNHPNFAVVNGTTHVFCDGCDDSLDLVDANSLSVIDTMRVGQEGHKGLGLSVVNRLVPVLSSSGEQLHSNGAGPPQALITVRQTAGLDMFQVIGRNLRLNGSHTASAVPVCEGCGGGNVRIPLVTFTASTMMKDGCGAAPQVLAFFKWFGVYEVGSLEIVED
ncbi:hypothetical protein PMZ80_002577 [Knufia obscura]|uniref:Uncharacterized protein n=1 Tax=Knufia obscura TaxID=1635080 RepID=A0ABR0RXR6_9EURO|nr:hypothetical protein PMZ80_002577 [Knufia obscura]